MTPRILAYRRSGEARIRLFRLVREELGGKWPSSELATAIMELDRRSRDAGAETLRWKLERRR